MHELSVCLALVTELDTLARRHEARIRRVTILVGPLAGAEPHLLAQAFPIACAGTPAEGAELNIESSVVRIRCRSCGDESIVAANRLTCPACGDWQTKLLGGDELILSQVELDVPAKATDAIVAAASGREYHV